MGTGANILCRSSIRQERPVVAVGCVMSMSCSIVQLS